MVAKPRRLVKASQRRAKNFMLLHGSYIHPSLERVQSEDRSVQQSQFDLCLVLLAVTVIRTTKDRVEVELHTLTRAEEMAYLYLICMNSSSIPMTYHTSIATSTMR